ncbi:unnamed protein product [Mytilus coruscus]|uniref:Uncharacterized protein n=1 Tax=Mytilus coruscus TaxID=42192 RepID=A0A6J8DGL2_MYTCO|nr:unnamed protein product [Mytilus coruscus]
MAEEKTKLARDGTMQVTAKEGINYLESSGKETLLVMSGLKDPEPEPPAKKTKLAKGTTMVGTAKEADRLLGDNRPDADAMTRGQQKQIDAISKEPPSTPKKAKLAKEGTMAATAKEAKELLGKEKLGDTRQETKRKTPAAKPAMKKTSTMAKTIAEAAWTVPDINVEEGRKTRSQASGGTPKPAIKRDGTMQKTAKEGKAFVKSGKKSKK